MKCIKITNETCNKVDIRVSGTPDTITLSGHSEVSNVDVDNVDELREKKGVRIKEQLND